MIIEVEHCTTYNYSEVVKQSIQFVRLSPRKSANQSVIEWQLSLPGDVFDVVDGFGNKVSVVTCTGVRNKIEIMARGEVDITGQDTAPEPCAIPPDEFLKPSPLTAAGPVITEFVERHKDFVNTGANLKALMQDILSEVPYIRGQTNISSTAEQAFAQHAGVCQDHTHIFISCCRELGVPAKYVSGFIYDSSERHVSTHAWAEAFCDGRWSTFDVSNQLTEPANHIKLAEGIDYLDACPVRGVRVGGGLESIDSDTSVEQHQTR